MALTRRNFNLSTLGLLASMGISSTLVAESGVNRRIVLASRPKGKPTLDNFRLEESAQPEPAQGQMLLKTRYLSLDPYMRGRMNAGKSYAERVELDDVMVGGTVCEVLSSGHQTFSKGDLAGFKIGVS